MTRDNASDPIPAFFERLAARHTPILVDISGGTRREVSGAELCPLLDRIAQLLNAQGARFGHPVICIFDNRLEAALLLLCALRHGLTICLQPPGTSPETLRKLQSDLDASVVISAAAPTAESTLWHLDLDVADQAEPLSPDHVPPHTPFTITFTSGSTGTPKGIVHSAESFFTCAADFNAQTGISAHDRFLNVMPMFYMAGIFNGILAPLVSGASVVIANAFDIHTAMTLWKMIADDQITALWLSPTMLSMLVRLDRTDKSVPPGLRRLFVGTGALRQTDAAAFHDTYGIVPLQSYGLSELLYVSVDAPEDPRFGSVGKPLVGVSLEMAPNAPLSITSKYSFLGYLSDGQLSPHRDPFTTTDLAEISSSGHLSILGRADDIILRGGVNINPAEIEELLTALLPGRTMCVLGLPDTVLGEKVVLVVAGAAIDPTVVAQLEQKLHAQPGRLRLDKCLALPSLPTGPTGKVRRSELRRLLESADAS